MPYDFDPKPRSNRVWQMIRERMGTAQASAPDPALEWEKLTNAPIGIAALHEFLEKSSLNLSAISKNLALDTGLRGTLAGRVLASIPGQADKVLELASEIRSGRLTDTDQLVAGHVGFVSSVARSFPEAMLIHAFVGYHELPKIPGLNTELFYEIIQPRIIAAIARKN